MMSEEAAAKRRRWEHSCSCRDSSSFNMEDLPEEIQPLVLSLLSLKEAARTSLVSRSWTKLWTRHPNLCFDGTRDHPSDEDAVKIERRKFIETVNSVIQQHSGVGLNKFSIRCSLHKKSSDHLDRWIGFASASKAKIININLWSKRCSIIRFRTDVGQRWNILNGETARAEVEALITKLLAKLKSQKNDT